MTTCHVIIPCKALHWTVDRANEYVSPMIKSFWFQSSCKGFRLQKWIFHLKPINLGSSSIRPPSLQMHSLPFSAEYFFAVASRFHCALKFLPVQLAENHTLYYNRQPRQSIQVLVTILFSEKLFLPTTDNMFQKTFFLNFQKVFSSTSKYFLSDLIWGRLNWKSFQLFHEFGQILKLKHQRAFMSCPINAFS